MNLKYSKMSVYGIMAVYKQEKRNSDLDISCEETISMQYCFYHRNIKLQKMDCKNLYGNIGNGFSTSVLLQLIVLDQGSVDTSN